MPIDCHYCGQYAYLVDTPYGPIYKCDRCQAWVGCHKGTTVPLGTVATARLRYLRMEAHDAFDPLWYAKMRKEGCGKGRARKAGYDWLAKHMGIEPDECHIALFDEEQCLKAIDICRNWRKYREK